MSNCSKIKYFILIGFFLLIFNNLKAQDYKRTAWWYFGNKAGLHFNDTSVIADTNSPMNAGEGTSVISDTNGNLLFYTNGITVWNKNHQIMDNGTGLLGSFTSTQPALIVPQPENDSIFYIFTTDIPYTTSYSEGLQYSIVNINKNNGLGKIISKNNLLITPVCEKITATKHANGKDIWIMVQGFPKNSFYCYLLTQNGLNECSIITNIGFNVNGSDRFDSQGEMKFSADGNYLATTLYTSRIVEIFNFDNVTGKLTEFNYIYKIFFPYGLEFSPNSKNLFITDRGQNLYQFDLKSNDFDTTGKSIHTATGYDKGQIQMSADNKLYISIFDSLFISVINNPDSSINKSDYNHLSINLKGIKKGPNERLSQFGLPNFITSYFYRPKINFSYNQECNNPTIDFKEKYNTSFSSILWNIYKDSTLIQSYSSSNPTHTFMDTGMYDVELIIDSDTARKNIYLEPDIFRYPYLVNCNQDSVELNIPDNFRCITWDNESTKEDSIVTKAGKYIVSAYNTMGCYITDSISVIFVTKGKPNINQLSDSLYSDSIADFYTWYKDGVEIPNSNQKGIKITDTGTYSVTVEDFTGCKNSSDNFEVNCQIQKPNIRRDGDTLHTDSIANAYVWFIGNQFITIGNIPKIPIADTGDYYVRIINNLGCEDSSDVFSISCENNTIPNIRRIGRDSLVTDSVGLKYTWYKGNAEIPNSNHPKIKTSENGIYKVIIEHKYKCKASSINFNVNYLNTQTPTPQTLNIYPNPTTNEISIEGIENRTIAKLFDITGKKLFEKYIDKNEKTISLLDFEDGIYILKINNQNFKIIKN